MGVLGAAEQVLPGGIYKKAERTGWVLREAGSVTLRQRRASPGCTGEKTHQTLLHLLLPCVVTSLQEVPVALAY